MKSEDLKFLSLSVPNFGIFYIKKVLLCYIYPRIFVCENNRSENLFLFAEMSNENRTDIWLTAKINKDEYNALVNKEKSIQDIYFSKAGNDIFTIFYDYVNEKCGYSFDIAGWLDDLPKEAVYAEND